MKSAETPAAGSGFAVVIVLVPRVGYIDSISFGIQWKTNKPAEIKLLSFKMSFLTRRPGALEMNYAGIRHRFRCSTWAHHQTWLAGISGSHLKFQQ